MNNWWALALLSGSALASRNVLLKIANFKLDPAFAAMILSISMAVTSIVFLFANRAYQARLERAVENVADAPASWTIMGLLPAICAGIGLAAANILLVFSYKAGGSAALVGILQTISAVGLTLTIGIFLLNETISMVQLLGIAVALAGMFLIIKG